MMTKFTHYLLNLDKAQAENRVVAYISNELRMIKAFEEGTDVHSLTASLIFNKPIDQVTIEDGTCPIGGGVYSERFWGKKANHGLNYDLGFKTFALDYEISESEARTIVESYHKAYPAIRRWHASIRTQLQRNRTLTTCSPFNRKRIFRDRWGDTLFKDAYSFIPQSTVAEMVNQWGINFTYYDISRRSPIELLNTVHDSITLQIPLSLPATQASELINEIVVNLNQPLSYDGREFVIPTDGEAGFNMGHWDKESNPEGLKKIKVTTLEDVGKLEKWLKENIYYVQA